MKEIPILFSTAMIRAILKGTKSATRRVIKPQPKTEHMYPYGFITGSSEKSAVGKFCWTVGEICDGTTSLARCPYGQPGDRLWVQETWKCNSFNDKTCALAIGFKTGGSTEAWFDSVERYEKVKKYYFKKGWQSPYFMPKEAARIWLNNEGVRVERVQEITEEDAKAEGLKDSKDLTNGGIFCTGKENFEGLWNTLNEKRGYGWGANPWVWVVEFRRVEEC